MSIFSFFKKDVEPTLERAAMPVIKTVDHILSGFHSLITDLENTKAHMEVRIEHIEEHIANVTVLKTEAEAELQKAANAIGKIKSFIGEEVEEAEAAVESVAKKVEATVEKVVNSVKSEANEIVVTVKADVTQAVNAVEHLIGVTNDAQAAVAAATTTQVPAMAAVELPTSPTVQPTPVPVAEPQPVAAAA